MAEAIAGRPTVRTSGRMYLVLATGFAVLAGLLAYAALRDSGGSSGGTAVATLARVVASEDIPARTRITADMVEVRAIPAEAALLGSFTESGAVLGLVTRYPIAANEQIGPQKVGATLADAQTETLDSGLSFVIPQGFRGVAISVTESSAVGGLVVAGDHVDVIALFDKELTGLERAVTVIQNVEVLAVAQVAQEAVPPAVEAEGDETGAASTGLGVRPLEPEPQPSARTVTLAVSPEDAQILALVEQNATLWLSLRAYDDDETPRVTDSGLLPLGVLHPDLRD